MTSTSITGWRLARSRAGRAILGIVQCGDNRAFLRIKRLSTERTTSRLALDEQVRLAKALGISQDGVSRLKKRSDLLLSTLRKTIEAMGGNLIESRLF